MSISKNAFLGVFYVVVHFVQVFSDLCKSSILGYLHLDGHLHIHLRVHTNLYFPFYLYNSSSSQNHLPSNFPLNLFPTHIAGGNAPVLVIFHEGVFYVLEISGGHH